MSEASVIYCIFLRSYAHEISIITPSRLLLDDEGKEIRAIRRDPCAVCASKH